MAEHEASISVPTSYTMKRLLTERAFQSGCTTSDLVRQALDADSASRSILPVSDIDRPFVTARLTRAQQDHLRGVSKTAGLSHRLALEVMLARFLFSDIPAAREASNEPDLFS